MTWTTYGRERMALALGSDISNNYVQYFGVGIGSKTELNSNVTLGSDWKRFSVTGSPDFTESRKVLFTGDLNSVQASGLVLTEFGLFNVSGTVVAYSAPGSTWSREQLVGSIVCDGTIELRLESTIEIM